MRRALRRPACRTPARQGSRPRGLPGQPFVHGAQMPPCTTYRSSRCPSCPRRTPSAPCGWTANSDDRCRGRGAFQALPTMERMADAHASACAGVCGPPAGFPDPDTSTAWGKLSRRGLRRAGRRCQGAGRRLPTTARRASIRGSVRGARLSAAWAIRNASYSKTTVRVPCSRMRSCRCQATARARTARSIWRPTRRRSSALSRCVTRCTSCSMIGPASRSAVT